MTYLVDVKQLNYQSAMKINGDSSFCNGQLYHDVNIPINKF